MNNGQLIMNVGGMFSGKSTLLLQQGERHSHAKRNIKYFKPSLDSRYSVDEIVTHKGVATKAINIGAAQSILDFISAEDQIILIDEIQFFEYRIVADIEALLYLGKTIYVAGLDKDFRGKAFKVTRDLMVDADIINKCHAICERCGNDASFSALIEDSEEEIEGNINLGANEKYVPLCRGCFYVK